MCIKSHDRLIGTGKVLFKLRVFFIRLTTRPLVGVRSLGKHSLYMHTCGESMKYFSCHKICGMSGSWGDGILTVFFILQNTTFLVHEDSVTGL